MSNGFHTSKLGLGTVQFGLDYGISNAHGQTHMQEVVGILETVGQHGITTLDTAYGYGSSEEVLGEIGVANFDIVSKFPIVKSPEAVFQSFHQSTKRLGVDHLYAYIAHSAQNLIEEEHLWEGAIALRKSGKVKKIGYSLYAPEELETLLKKQMIPDLIQVPYNLLDRRFEGFFDELKGMGTEIHTRSSFLQGLFFLEHLEEHFAALKEVHTTLRAHAGNTRMLAAMLLGFCLNHQYIDKVIFGVNHSGQLNENLQALELLKKEQIDWMSDLEIPQLSENVLNPSQWP